MTKTEWMKRRIAKAKGYCSMERQGHIMQGHFNGIHLYSELENQKFWTRKVWYNIFSTIIFLRSDHKVRIKGGSKEKKHSAFSSVLKLYI